MRIAIVNDLRLACVALGRAIAADPRHSVAWTALDGEQAVANARRDRPDLILMDMIMPGVDGVEATRRIMKESPCPILVVTSTVAGNIGKVYEAMGHGALDAVETPTLGSDGRLQGGQALLEKIRRIERLAEKPKAGLSATHAALPDPTVPRSGPGTRFLLIGASTGGPTVLAGLLAGLPRGLPAAVVIAQHVDEAYAPGLAHWLGERSALPVEIPAEGAAPAPGRVYLADSRKHLSFAVDRRLRYVDEPPGTYRPSVDVLFESAARHAPAPGVAVLLTGMGRDGAAGMLALRRSGWTTLAQDQATSVVWGMPKAAIDAGAAVHVLPPERMTSTIVAALRPAAAPFSPPSRPA